MGVHEVRFDATDFQRAQDAAVLGAMWRFAVGLVGSLCLTSYSLQMPPYSFLPQVMLADADAHAAALVELRRDWEYLEKLDHTAQDDKACN